jgi:hypothetical protein
MAEILPQFPLPPRARVRNIMARVMNTAMNTAITMATSMVMGKVIVLSCSRIGTVQLKDLTVDDVTRL